jgi:hypothetical protein
MANGSDRSWDTPPNVQGIKACIADWDPARGLHQGQQSFKRLHKQAEDKTASDLHQSVISSLATREPSRQDISVGARVILKFDTATPYGNRRVAGTKWNVKPEKA